MKYTRDDLMPINFHSLRNLGRMLGVKNPTKLKKNEIIEQILQIQSGELAPCKPTGMGRPLKPTVEQKNSEDEKKQYTEEYKIMRAELKELMIQIVLEEIEKKLNELL